MSDMFDYLEWRGDIRFSQMPLNAVDALIFSALAYIRFENIVPEDSLHWISLEDAAQELLALPDAMNRGRVKNDILLLEAAAQTARFRQAGLSFYRDRFIPEEEVQFAAVTFFMEDGKVFVAFRGTDDTLIGWKEDFNMSFQESIPAQRMAVQYIKEFAEINNVPLYVGGHSKGGNLSVYAAAKCGLAVQERILQVYNHDGPGFTEYMMGDLGYLSVVPKICTYIPQSSVIGMLLEHEEPYTVIKSKHIGVMQHDPYTWEVKGPDFIHMEEITADSRFIDRTLKNWLAGMSREERGDFVDAVFDLLTANNASKTNDIMKPKNVRGYLQTLSNDEEMRNLLAGKLAALLRAMKKK